MDYGTMLIMGTPHIDDRFIGVQDSFDVIPVRPGSLCVYIGKKHQSSLSKPTKVSWINPARLAVTDPLLTRTTASMMIL